MSPVTLKTVLKPVKGKKLSTQMLRHIDYLLQRGQLLFEVVHSLQQLPLFQQVMFGQVQRCVQQVHNMLHVIQPNGMLTGHCNRGHNKVEEDEKVR